MQNYINIFTDGGARGNPGPSAIGVYIENEKEEKIAEISKTIGNGTNNVAEYKAVIEGLNWVIENKKKFDNNLKINFYMDSKLVCSQIIGTFKVKNSGLLDLLFDIRNREAQIKFPVYYNHIPREKNTKADFLVNKALNKRG